MPWSVSGQAGNTPIDRYIAQYGFTSFNVPNDNERFALTAEPLSFCHSFVEPDKEYRMYKNNDDQLFAADETNGRFGLICPKIELAPILGINYESSLTGEIFYRTIANFIQP